MTDWVVVYNLTFTWLIIWKILCSKVLYFSIISVLKLHVTNILRLIITHIFFVFKTKKGLIEIFITAKSVIYYIENIFFSIVNLILWNETETSGIGIRGQRIGWWLEVFLNMIWWIGCICGIKKSVWIFRFILTEIGPNL